jgi:hypothetical protein
MQQATSDKIKNKIDVHLCLSLNFMKHLLQYVEGIFNNKLSSLVFFVVQHFKEVMISLSMQHHQPKQ